MQLLGHWNFIVFVVLMMIGFYVVIASTHFVKKLIGLSTFQTAVFIFYITLGKVDNGTAPIVLEGAGPVLYSNPLPHVLILTAIVVGVATLAVGLALTIRIHEAYGSVDEEDIRNKDIAFEALEYQKEAEHKALWEKHETV